MRFLNKLQFKGGAEWPEDYEGPDVHPDLDQLLKTHQANNKARLLVIREFHPCTGSWLRDSAVLWLRLLLNDP